MPNRLVLGSILIAASAVGLAMGLLSCPYTDLSQFVERIFP